MLMDCLAIRDGVTVLLSMTLSPHGIPSASRARGQGIQLDRTRAGHIYVTRYDELTTARAARGKRSGHGAVGVPELQPHSLGLIERRSGATPTGDLVDGVGLALSVRECECHHLLRCAQGVPEALPGLDLVRRSRLALTHGTREGGRKH
jgi:hypothetical protein